MATLEELLAEKARRASTQGAATRPVQNGGGGSAAGGPPGYTMLDALRLAGPSKPKPTVSSRDKLLGAVRSGLEGMTLGTSDAIGAGVATAMAFPQTLRQQAQRQRDAGREVDLIDAIRTGVPETYRDIRGTLQMEEDNFEAAHPDLARGMELGGGAAMLAAGTLPALARTAAPLAAGTRAALARGSARVGGKGAAAASAAKAAKPRFRPNPDGTYTAMNDAAKELVKNMGKVNRKQVIKDSATLGAEYDVAESLISGDHSPDATIAAAAAGAVFPKSIRNLLINTPLSRLILARGASKVIGQKYQPYIYTGSHPATRRALKEVFKGAAE